MTSYNRDGKVGPWAREKLDCLGRYLNAYTTIMRKQHWCRGYFYFDAFAGAGRAQIRRSEGAIPTTQLPLQISASYTDDSDELSYVNGSPFVALGIQNPFTRYFFVEKNPSRAQELRSIQEEYAGRREIRIQEDDAAHAIERFLNEPGIDWQSYRAVMFLDPFGMQVPWSVIAQIAQTRSIEIILNLPVGMAIQRLLPRSGDIKPTQREMLSAYFGTTEWEDVIYQKSEDMFGGMDIAKAWNAGKKLADWYRDRLKALFGFAPPPRLICNTQGTHLYYLFFAGPNETGAKIAAHILKQGQPLNRR